VTGLPIVIVFQAFQATIVFEAADCQYVF